MTEYMAFWFAKTLTELLIALGLCLALCAIPIGFMAVHAIKHWRCKHEQFFENGRCHAICRACRKDLGFIGTVREQRKEKK